MRLIERECFTRAGFWQAGFGYFYLEGDRRASEARRSKTEWDRGLALAAPRGSGELVLLARLVKQHAMPRKAGNEQSRFLFLLTHTVHASLPSACNASHSPRVGCSDWPSSRHRRRLLCLAVTEVGRVWIRNACTLHTHTDTQSPAPHAQFIAIRTMRVQPIRLISAAPNLTSSSRELCLSLPYCTCLPTCLRQPAYADFQSFPENVSKQSLPCRLHYSSPLSKESYRKTPPAS